MKPIKNRKPLFERLKTGLEQASEHAKGNVRLKSTFVELPDKPPALTGEDVLRIRLENRMSQAVFAGVLNVSPKTVRSWEQGSRKPSHASLRLIQVIGKNPKLVLQALGMTSTRIGKPSHAKAK